MEMRSWGAEYRGKLWLHAAKAADPDLERAFGLTNTFKGGFIGSVFVSAIVPLDSQRWSAWQNRHLVSGEYRPGQFGWLLERPVRFKLPISASGRLNLFQVDMEMSRALEGAELLAIDTVTPKS